MMAAQETPEAACGITRRWPGLIDYLSGRLVDETASAALLMLHKIRCEATDDNTFVLRAEALVNYASEALCDAIRDELIYYGVSSADIAQVRDRTLAAFYAKVNDLMAAVPPQLVGNA